MPGLHRDPSSLPTSPSSVTPRRRNVILLGFMGTGKSLVGRRLAEAIGYRFVDTDKVIEAQWGQSIARIIQSEGEEKFRGIESRVVREVAGLAGHVIATGGGVVLNPDNVEALRQNGILVALTARPEVILKRVQKRIDERPLLTGPDPLARIKTLLKEREGYYRVGAFSVDTSSQPVSAVVHQIKEGILRHEG